MVSGNHFITLYHNILYMELKTRACNRRSFILLCFFGPSRMVPAFVSKPMSHTSVSTSFSVHVQYTVVFHFSGRPVHDISETMLQHSILIRNAGLHSHRFMQSVAEYLILQQTLSYARVNKNTNPNHLRNAFSWLRSAIVSLWIFESP